MSAVGNGFTVRDFEDMTIGMITDSLSETIPDGERIVKATKEDIQRML